jgi:hypothetical protein
MILNLKLTKVFTFGRSAERGGVATGIPGGGGAPGAPGGGPFPTGGGPQGGSSPGRRYTLTIGVSARNILNSTIPGAIIGNITSPLFGRANQAGAGGFGGGGTQTGAGAPFGNGQQAGTGFSEAANNRRLELQTRLTF